MVRQEKTVGEVKVLMMQDMTIETRAVAWKWLEEATAEQPALVVANLNEVEYMDSVGLTMLLDALKRARLNKGDLHLCGVKHPVRMVIELTRLHRVFNIFPTEPDAIGAFIDPELKAITMARAASLEDLEERGWKIQAEKRISSRSC